VDFYSGIIYRAIGIPTRMFTVMFALGRLPGWIAQWKEMMENKEPIGRPRQIYTGATVRNYVPMVTGYVLVDGANAATKAKHGHGH
jgi:citrate synthase